MNVSVGLLWLILAALNLCWCKPVRECGDVPIITQTTQPGLHAEGPFWDILNQVLFYVDIEGQSVIRYDPAAGRITRAKIPGGDVSFVIPVKGTNSHWLLVARGHDLLLLDWNYEDAIFSPDHVNLTYITSVENEKGLEGNRWNEAKADIEGRLWAGTMGFDPTGMIKTKNKAALYVLNPNSTRANKVVANVSISNAMAWNPDNTLMYYTDTRTRRIDVFDYDVERGLISNRRKLYDFKENNIPGNPDGIIIDNKGNLWIACYFGGIVVNIDPRTGTLIRTLKFPTSLVTSVTWGGPNLDVLYVTTSKIDLSVEEKSKQPLAGAVFTVRCLGVKANAPANEVVRDK